MTFEPLPARLSSLAGGTGDVDGVYYRALCELEAAVGEIKNTAQAEMLKTIVSGCRPRDISDLPFDPTA